MIKEEIEKWIEKTKNAGYIDCDDKLEGIDDEEFKFIMQMAEELLKRIRRSYGIKKRYKNKI